MLLHHCCRAHTSSTATPRSPTRSPATRDGQRLAEEIFGDTIIWLPYVDPGFTLAQALKQALADHAARNGGSAKAILMANHGLIVAGDSRRRFARHTDEMLDKICRPARRRLGNCVVRPADATAKTRRELVRMIGPALRGLLADGDRRTQDRHLRRLADRPRSGRHRSRQGGSDAGPLTPDQIVYCGSFPLWFEPRTARTKRRLVDRLRDAIDAAQHDAPASPPKIVLVAGRRPVRRRRRLQASRTRPATVYLDAVKVMAGATRLGGVSYLTDRERQFIEDWEVESYRERSLRQRRPGGRLKGKVAVVTGAARDSVSKSPAAWPPRAAHVVLADVNEAGVASCGRANCARHTAPARGLGLADERHRQRVDPAGDRRRSFARTAASTCSSPTPACCEAESVKTQSEQDFDFVTDVNYKGYFLCVQKAAPVLATQHRAKPDYWSDIIQINSKSGLSGSKKNFAYAGSKFGGIGLTQSFALELVEDGIKVNSICPGNFSTARCGPTPRRACSCSTCGPARFPARRRSPT